MSSAYTPAMVAELRAIGEVTRKDAEAFAERNGLSLKSVITKIHREDGISYVKPEPKAATPSRSKADIVSSVESLLGSQVDSLWGLERATVRALREVEDRIQTVLDQNHQDYMDDIESALNGTVPPLYAAYVKNDTEENPETEVVESVAEVVNQ